MIEQIKIWARRIKRDVIALYIAAHDARTPKMAKVLAVMVAAYALSPIDLIPDFIPLLGLIDDAIILPLGIMLVVRLIRPDLMTEFRAQALEIARLPANKTAAVFIILVWMVMISIAIWWMAPPLVEPK